MYISILVAFDEVKSFSDGMYTETEDEGFMAGPNKSTLNIGWLLETSTGGSSATTTSCGKSPHIDIYETGQVKPPPYLNVKEAGDSAIPSFGYNLSRSKSVCDLSMEQNCQLLKNGGTEKSFTIDKNKKVIAIWQNNNTLCVRQQFEYIKSVYHTLCFDFFLNTET